MPAHRPRSWPWLDVADSPATSRRPRRAAAHPGSPILGGARPSGPAGPQWAAQRPDRPVSNPAAAVRVVHTVWAAASRRCLTRPQRRPSRAHQQGCPGYATGRYPERCGCRHPREAAAVSLGAAFSAVLAVGLAAKWCCRHSTGHCPAHNKLCRRSGHRRTRSGRHGLSCQPKWTLSRQQPHTAAHRS